MTEPDFDLDAWISGAKAPERTATVYGRGDLVAEAEVLAAEIAEADRAKDPDRMNSGADPALKDRLQALRGQFESSALQFRFRAPTRDAVRKVQAEVGDSDEEAFTYALLSLQVVSPRVEPAQWSTIRDRVGAGQFQALVDAANACYADARLDIPFSLAVSAPGRSFSRS